MARTTDLDGLLRHRGWIQALAADLVGDAHRAEDVVQETWVAALERRPGGPAAGEPARPWLALVARNLARMTLRGESRRRHREELRARTEAEPSVLDALARVSLQREVASAVMALPEPDREIVALRYYEDVPPRAIAKRLGLTPSAVHSRLTRARATLRARLAPEGDREGRIRLRALAGAAARPGPDHPSLPLAASGGLALKTTTKVIALSVLVLLAAFGVRELTPLRGDRTPPGPEGPVRLLAPPVEDSAALEAAEVEREGGARRTAVVAEPEPEPTLDAVAVPTRTGTVLVTVREAATGEGAAGVGLSVNPWNAGNAWFHARSRVTGEDGTARFEGLPPGELGVYVERLCDQRTFGSERVAVVAGETVEVAFAVVAGDGVHGRVVDWAGRPVEGASIWLGTGSGPPREGQVVARSAADGRFVVPYASRSQGLAARKTGYAPSLAQLPLFAAPDDGDADDGDAFVELVLPGLGGALEGIVVDAAGRPQADAIVVAGNARVGHVVRDLGHPAYDPPDLRLRTDREGRFRAEGLAAGRVRVRARALGASVAEREVDVPPGGSASVRLVVGAAARIAGRVARADGSAAAGARISLEYDTDELRTTTAFAGADGAFVLEDVPAGELEVLAELEAEGLETRATLATRAGETTTWQAIFPTPCVVSGRVLDDESRPLAGWSVRRETRGADPRDSMAGGRATTDAAGRFELDPCPPSLQDLSVRPPGQLFADPVATLEAVEPWAGEVTMTVAREDVPAAALRGRVTAPGGEAIAGALVRLLVLRPTFVHVETRTGPDGGFRVDGLPASRFELTVEAAGFVDLAREVEALGEQEQRELGDLVLVAGE